jgi:hypothetical protein
MHLAHHTRLLDQDKVKLWRAAKLVELLVDGIVKGLSTVAQKTRRGAQSDRKLASGR